MWGLATAPASSITSNLRERGLPTLQSSAHGMRREMLPSRVRVPDQISAGHGVGPVMQRRLRKQALPKLAHPSELVVLERLLDFGAAVHHERPLSNNGLGDVFTTHDQQLGVRCRFCRDSLA